MTENSPRPAHRSSDVKPSAKRRIIVDGDKEDEGRRTGVKGKMEEEEEDKGRGHRDPDEKELEEEERIRQGRLSDKPGKRGLKRVLQEEEEEEGALPSAQEEGNACLRKDSKENASPRKRGDKGLGKPPANRSNKPETFENR